VGKKVFSKKVGLLGALFLAFSSEHVQYSHYITTDVPVAFFTLVTFLLALLILEKGDTKYYILGGLLAGLTAATKYQAVLVFSCVFFAGVMRLLAGKKEYRKIIYSIIALGGGFLIGVPFAIMEAPTFLSDIRSILQHYREGHLSAQGTANWWYYLVYFYREGMGKGILVLSICGLVFIAIRSNEKRFLCLVFVILLFTRIYSAKVRFARNLMPLLPFLSLFAAFFLSYWLDWWAKIDFVKKRRFLQIFVFVFLIGGLLFAPARIVWNWTYKKAHNEINPRALAKEWVESHIPAGTVIATEWFTAPLNQFDSKRRYKLVAMDFLARRNIDWYRERGVSYVMASIGYERCLPEWTNFPYYVWIPNYEEMLHHLELLKQIGDIKIYRVKPNRNQGYP
jgi:4-amino-4-deoxy-L-arabinose transferase-like glycosyltransferase